MSNTDLVSISKAAKMLNVHANTLKRWEMEGLVHPVRFGKRGDRKYKIQEIESLINDSRKFGKPYGTDFPKITVVAVILHKGKILLGKRNRKLKHGFYALPGGYLSAYEKLEDAIISEVKEETGLNLKNAKYIGLVESIEQVEKIHTINIGYLSDLKHQPKDIKANDEVDKWEWFPLKKLPKKMMEADKKMLQLAQSH